MPVIGALDVALATKRTGDATVDPDSGEETVTEPAYATALSINTTLTNLHAENVLKSASVLFFIGLSTPYKLNNETAEIFETDVVGYRVCRVLRTRPAKSKVRVVDRQRLVPASTKVHATCDWELFPFVI